MQQQKRTQDKTINGPAVVHAPNGHDLALFKLLYESRDGRLCLFEDKDGHLTAVRADRLA